MRRKTDPFVVACVLLCLLCTAVTVLFVAPTVLDTKSRAERNSETTRQIQQERADNILRSCREVNDRHDSSIDTLNRVVLERLSHRDVPRVMPPSEVKVRLAAAMKLADPPVRSQIQQSLGSTALLIDALAPKRDCQALVAQQVNTKPR